MMKRKEICFHNVIARVVLRAANHNLSLAGGKRTLIYPLGPWQSPDTTFDTVLQINGWHQEIPTAADAASE